MRTPDNPGISPPNKPNAPLGKDGLNTPTRKNVPVTDKGSKGSKHHDFDRNTISSTLDSDDMLHSEDSANTTGIGLVHGGDGLLDYVDAMTNHIADCLMVDTLDLTLSNVPSINRADLKRAYGQIDDNNELVGDSDWAKGSLQSPHGKQSLRVRYVQKTKQLTVEGSPAMHYQGQNVVSSGDVTMLSYMMFRAVNKQLRVDLPIQVGYEIANGRLAEVTRIDVVLLLRVPDGVMKSALINALAIAGIQAGNNISLYVNESVYFDQNSQTESQKLYDKAAQLGHARKGGLPDVEGVELLNDLNEKTIRLEAVFRTRKLVQVAKQHGSRPHPCVFTPKVLAKMVKDLLYKYSSHDQIFRRLDYKQLRAIALPYRSTVAHWQNDMCLEDMVISDRVLKEHAAYIWNNHRINIKGPSPDSMHVPMSLYDILSPKNFIPVPPDIRNSPVLFHEEDMDSNRSSIQRRLIQE
ncbi:hypothetical protein os1_02700 [Comamonadaceae bacterium OS-1]|nr:hypothetical protein os1_02700 [Comamonadaceae bacterium OS-1]